MSRRRHAASIIAKLFAVCLIVLVASPFTAPFQTWTATPPAGERADHDTLSKLNTKAVPAVFVCPGLAMVAALHARVLLPYPAPVPVRPPLTVLRL